MTDFSVALLRASGLPERWRGRDRFVVLESGFAGARLFLAAWRAWRDDPQRCGHLHWIAIDPDLRAAAQLDSLAETVPADSLVRELSAAWPPLTPNLHRLAFDSGRAQLLLMPGTPAACLREIVARADAFIDSDLDGPDWLACEPRVAKAIARIAAPHATFVSTHADAASQAQLQAAGFRFAASEPGTGPIRSARYEPGFDARPAVGRSTRRASAERHALIVGAGLAGCATAWALAEHGWHCTVIERHAAIAGEASGNPVGLFHGIVNGYDGPHARFNRAAALQAHAAVRTAIDRHAVLGSTHGLLQLCDAASSVPAMRHQLERLRLPGSYVQALDADEASALAGVSVQRPAWFYPGGGFVQPTGLARAFLERGGAAIELRCGSEVASLRRDGAVWQLLDVDSRVLATSRTVVLANAGDALRLIGGAWPVAKVRGQISVLPAACTAGLVLPRLPITGSGYLLPPIDGSLFFGATSQPGDDEPAVRDTDHAHNLAQLGLLAPTSGLSDGIDADRLEGRTAWRWTSRDRLPLIGAVPRALFDLAAGLGGRALRLDQPRFVPRQDGLFVFAALGSRGITWSALGAQVLAAVITGAPSPVEASLLDAIDPARFIVREHRRTIPAPR